MMTDLFVLLISLAVLISGGYLLVRGGAALAQIMGISPLVVGLTVVAFGTSAPELFANLAASLRHTTNGSAIAFGNVVGSNICNIGVILGLAVIIRPLHIHSRLIEIEIPMMVLAGLVTLALGADRWLNGRADGLDRGDGLVLLLLFAVFLYYTIMLALRQSDLDPVVQQIETSNVMRPGNGKARAITMTLLGLLMLSVAARFTVHSAINLAEAMNAPAALIGLTIVAVGTSLPELITSAIAAWRDEPDLAVGNVVGSNIFNLLFVLGLSATIRPIQVPSGGTTDLVVMALFAAVLLPLSMTHQRRMVRWEGCTLLAAYLTFVVWRAAG